MTLSSLDTTDTNCTANPNPLSSQSRSPPHDTRTGLFPEIDSHELLSPDIQPQRDISTRTSPSSSAMNTPNLSRSTSPLPQFYSSTQSSASDTDNDEPGSPLLLDTYGPTYLRDHPPRWWHLRQRPRRGARRPTGWRRLVVRVLRRVFRHPFFPKHPTTIVCFSFTRVHARWIKSIVPSYFLFCFSPF